MEKTSPSRVSIIGTGDFGRALGVRLIQGGYEVTYGSQDPSCRRDFMEAVNPALTGVGIVRIPDALEASNVIILAINAQQYASLRPYAKLLDGKIVVEVSNPEESSKEESAAERLQAMFPTANVCKAFNTVSAYALSDSNPVAGGSNVVYVSADDLEVRAHVKRMAVDMGLQALEMGGLQSARKLERAQQTLLLGWGWATVVTGVWFTFWLIYETCRRYVMRETDPSRWPMNVFNVIMSCMAVTNLALCYLPGCIAAFLQIAWGTKYRAFPRWMDLWLKMRKQLGLYGLIFALMHVFISVCLLNPCYYPFFYKTNSTDSHGHMTGHNLMNGHAELTILLGALSTGLYILLGITSLPSVGAMLNWREWRFVQSYLGHACLLLAQGHVVVLVYRLWLRYTFVKLIQSPHFLSLVLGFFAMFFRIILWIPCVNSYVWKIRKGYVRGAKRDEEASVSESDSGDWRMNQNNGYVHDDELNVKL